MSVGGSSDRDCFSVPDFSSLVVCESFSRHWVQSFSVTANGSSSTNVVKPTLAFCFMLGSLRLFEKGNKENRVDLVVVKDIITVSYFFITDDFENFKRF